jgi:hypothetical protein
MNVMLNILKLDIFITMSNPLDTVIFEGKTSSDVFKEIYSNSKKKDKQINSLIAELKPLIQNIGDAPVVVPLIKEYLEIGVKNDEHLIKMMAVIQRINNNAASSGGDSLLTDEELKQLQQIAEEVAQNEPKKKSE